MTSQIRKENIDHNNNRVKEANSESEIWKIVNEVNKPKNENEWNMSINGKVESDEQKIAEAFNDYFVNKIVKLKDNIEQSDVVDPLDKLKTKMEGNTCKFSLKSIKKKKLIKIMKKLKKKKSAGVDGLSQDMLTLGAYLLATPLSTIINKSITDGVFPNEWKEALITPVLKKGDPGLLSNYRPVSCLPAASKLLESVVTEQLGDYLEENRLLPQNQHGFRRKRSTMTAWTDIQQEWAQKTESKMITGVLLWDLTAAFDTLDHEILCNKLALYGFDEKAIQWVRSFLTGRTQKVKIGNAISSKKNLASGVAQGGVLSPLIFVLYVSDLDEWLEWSSAITYADDTTTGVSDEDIKVVKRRLESDAKNVLRFMASNGLVAYPKKTTLVILNQKQNLSNGTPISLKIGSDTITQEKEGKLLGLTFNEKQDWKTHLYGKGGLISALNMRLFAIRRLKNHMSEAALKKIADGIFTSKIRYGLQLFGKVRYSDEDPTNEDFTGLQTLQNKMMRLITGISLKDRVSTKKLLERTNALSINQINAQIKIQEIWKAINIKDYPVTVQKHSVQDSMTSTRACTRGKLQESGKSVITQKTCKNDAIKLWNSIPKHVQSCKSLNEIKVHAKIFAKTLPI